MMPRVRDKVLSTGAREEKRGQGWLAGQSGPPRWAVGLAVGGSAGVPYMVFNVGNNDRPWATPRSSTDLPAPAGAAI